MIELVVGMAMGMIVLAGLTMVLIVVMHGNARVDARVEATDNARLTVTRIIEELHSACIHHGDVPVKGESDQDRLVFERATGADATGIEPPTTTTTIELNGGTLTQTDSPGTGRILLTNVAPAGENGALFTYSPYGGVPIPATTEIGKEQAEEVILVNVALTASPRSTPVADAGAAATVQDSATLLLTPPSSSGTDVKPCE